MSDIPNNMTAEEFSEKINDFPDGGRWTELCCGEVHILEPPDDVHGNVIYHLSQSIALSIDEQHNRTGKTTGYACFDHGVIVSRNPDTIQFPPISYFVTDQLFEITDQTVTETSPDLVIEIASTPQRRNNLENRIQNYLSIGTRSIWVIDPIKNEITTYENSSSNLVYSGNDSVKSPEFLPKLSVKVSELFRDPDWYK